MSAGRIAAVSLLTRTLLPLVTPVTCASKPVDCAVAGSLLRASQTLLRQLTAVPQGNRWSAFRNLPFAFQAAGLRCRTWWSFAGYKLLQTRA